MTHDLLLALVVSSLMASPDRVLRDLEESTFEGATEHASLDVFSPTFRWLQTLEWLQSAVSIPHPRDESATFTRSGVNGTSRSRRLPTTMRGAENESYCCLTDERGNRQVVFMVSGFRPKGIPPNKRIAKGELSPNGFPDNGTGCRGASSAFLPSRLLARNNFRGDPGGPL